MELDLVLQGRRPVTASVGVCPQDPYQAYKAWSRLPRAMRQALMAVGLDAAGLARLALVLGRAQIATPIRPGHRLEIALASERPAKRPAPKVQIVRHPEWAGLETVEERFLHSR
jgi:hypothetical protein